MPPRRPPRSRCPTGARRRATARAPAEELLINPFEEGCFHDEYLDASGANKQRRTRAASSTTCWRRCCGLALSVLCHALVLPGFFMRFGARLTRVSNFDERWLPTSHFFDLERLQASYVREPAVENAAAQGAPAARSRRGAARRNCGSSRI